MNEFKIGDEVRRLMHGSGQAPNLQGTILSFRNDGTICDIRITVESRHTNVGNRWSCDPSPLSNWELVVLDKYPRIKTRFLDGYTV